MNTYSFELGTIIASVLKSTVIFAVTLYISELMKLAFGKRIKFIDLVVNKIKKIDPSYLLRLSIAIILSISLFLFSVTGNLKLGILVIAILSCISVIPVFYFFKNPSFNIFSSFDTIIIVIPPFLSSFITLSLTSFIMIRHEESLFWMLLYCFLSAIIAFFLSIPLLGVSIFSFWLISTLTGILIGIFLILIPLIYDLIPYKIRPFRDFVEKNKKIKNWLIIIGIIIMIGEFFVNASFEIPISSSPHYKHIILMSFAFLSSVTLAVIITIITTKSQVYWR
jgi:hypothetical protein